MRLIPCVEEVPRQETSGTGLQHCSLGSLRDSNRFKHPHLAFTGGADCIENPLTGIR